MARHTADVVLLRRYETSTLINRERRGPFASVTVGRNRFYTLVVTDAVVADKLNDHRTLLFRTFPPESSILSKFSNIS